MMPITEVSPVGPSGHSSSYGHPLVDRMARTLAAGDFVLLLHESAALAERSRQAGDVDALIESLRAFSATGTVPTLIAVEAFESLPHEAADVALVDLLADPRAVVRRHAAWRLGSRLPVRRAYLPLLELLVSGGSDTLHAHRTLRSWARSDRRLIVELASVMLVTTKDALARARLVDLVGAVGGADAVLCRIALDSDEHDPARIAAIGALGECIGSRAGDTLQLLAVGDDEVAATARLALAGRLDRPAVGDERGTGLRLAQLVLAEGLDGQLSRGGRGDIGGVASLLVSLGEALARRPEVERVLTIGRGSVTDALVAPTPPIESPTDPTVAYGVLALGSGDRPAAAPGEIWEQLPTIERGLRRALRQAGPIDVLHLRMADAGTLAGFEVAQEMGIPVCFSVAPDPHNVIESLQSRGELDADRFVALDESTDVWFRARLIERLTRSSAQLAVFPRAEPMEFVDSIGGGLAGQRAAVVAEGIDLTVIDRARGQLAEPPATPTVLNDLAGLIPPSRRHLPLVLSVGRLHPVKGMERIVDAWAGDPELHASSNLVIVGGDLEAPSASEREVLDAIDRVLPYGDPRRDGLVMLGGRPRADVAALQAATATGCVGAWPGGGVYVDGALKEEFGLAVIEALATGLVVVAPSTGGPSTYVDDGTTGVLVAPDHDLAAAIRRAFGLVDQPGRARRARRMVEERYSIESMAGQLVDLYRPAEVRS